MTTENNQIAVIILNYFGAKTTLKCIDSVRKTLNPTIFLVDNSADRHERKRLVMQFGSQEYVRMLFPSENIGFAAGVNRGLKEAIKKGFQRFFLLNNDTILLDGLKPKLEETFEKWPGALISPVIKWDGRPNKGYYYHKYFGLIAKEKFSRSNCWLYYLSGCALAFDREFLDNIGYLNEKFFMYGEDIELAYRAQNKKIPIIVVPDELVIHEGSHSAEMASFFYEYHITRSHYLLCFFLFRDPFSQMVAVLLKTLTMSLRAFLRCIRYKTLGPVKALLLAPLAIKVRPCKKYSGARRSPSRIICAGDSKIRNE
jgi:GT2 family glycosyltransferase